MFSSNAPQPEQPMSGGSYLAPLESVDNVSAQHHLKLGKSLYNSYLTRSRQQDLDAAVKHFQKAVEIEPNFAEAYVQLASALWDQGTINLELAQFYCQTALKLDPNQPDAHLFLGYFLQRAGLLADAETEFAKAVQKSGIKSGRARIALSHVMLKQSLAANKTPQKLGIALGGIHHFVMGCALIPFDPEAFGILRDAISTDLQVVAIEHLARGFKSVKMPGLASKMYQMGTKLLPKEPIFHHILGDEALFDSREAQSAIAYYQAAVELEPHDTGLQKKLAKAYLESGQTDEGLAVLHQILDALPQDFDTLYQLGQIYTDATAYMKALYYFKEAEKLRPTYPYVQSNMAYVMFKMDDLEGAYEKYKLALDYGTDPIWLSSVAQTLGTMASHVYGDTQQALDFLQQALECNPENEDALMLVADLYFEAGEMDMALSAYRTILEINPANADCLSNIGYILWQMDENNLAIEAYLKSLELDPANMVAFNNLGVIYLDDEVDPDKAIGYFKQALALKSDYTLACFNIGRCYQEMGQMLEAAEFYSKALTLNQSNPELDSSEIQDYLDRLFD